MTESKDGWNYLEANAYHEAGHAIVVWALGGHVLEIKIRDDRPGEHTQTEVPEDLRLIDRVAILNAGHEAEVVFGHSLPDWASSGDRTNTLNLLAANEIREIPEIEGWIVDGCAHARKVLRKHEREVHALAARLVECRRMAGDEFKQFVDTIKEQFT